MDSNHRRHSQQIYSLPHLATLVTTQKLLICELSLFDKSFVLKSECKGSVFFSFHQIFLHLFSLFFSKNFIFSLKIRLLPFQGVLLTAIIPRVLPWARSFCPFRAWGVKHASALYLSLRPVTVGSGREGYELLSFYFLPFNFYNVVSAMFSRQSSVLVVLDFLDRNEDG